MNTHKSTKNMFLKNFMHISGTKRRFSMTNLDPDPWGFLVKEQPHSIQEEDVASML